MINYVIALVMFCGLTTPAYGEYYKYQDANGNVIFTDNPSNIPEDRRYEMKTVMEPKRNKETIAENDLPDRRKVKCPKCGAVFTIDVLLEEHWRKQLHLCRQ